jgi:mxaA protein
LLLFSASLHAQTAALSANDDDSTKPSVVVEQPRPYGYLVGDVLLQKIRLAVAGEPVEILDLPRKDRIGVWLARRGSTIETRADGTRWLVIDYQIVNASKDVDVIALPKLHLRTRGDPKVFVDVPDWPITVGAITPGTVRNQGGLLELQPDRPAPMVATNVIRHQLHQSLLALVTVLLLWLGWWRWREWRASEQQPFARARRALHGLSPSSPVAWRTLHHAFDATAGRVLQPSTLPLLFERAPQYAPLRADIERFYADSAALFFGGAQPAADPLLPLCTRLRAIEKRHEP